MCIFGEKNCNFHYELACKKKIKMNNRPKILSEFIYKNKFYIQYIYIKGK